MTPDERRAWLAEVKARVEAATTGPWTWGAWHGEALVSGDHRVVLSPGDPYCGLQGNTPLRPDGSIGCEEPRPEDLAFLAAAREDIPRLLAHIRALDALVALEDLAGWEPVGARVEGVRTALGGGEGVRADEVDILVQLAARWSSLRIDLRAFYLALAPVDRTADVALRRILWGGPPLAGWQYAILSRKWEAATGMAPSIELVPTRPGGGA